MMAKKRESSGRKTLTPKAATMSSELTGNTVAEARESERSSNALPASIDPETRRRLVAAEAYFRAERRGFAHGRELEDWVAAEMAVDSRLRQMQAA